MKNEMTNNLAFMQFYTHTFQTLKGPKKWLVTKKFQAVNKNEKLRKKRQKCK